MTHSEFKEVWNRIDRFIEETYAIPVRISDVADANTGDFDGASIQVAYDQDVESALFVLIHLFGHTVQWNISELWRQIGQNSGAGTAKTDEEMQLIYHYERDATRYSLGLLRAVQIEFLDRWASDFWHADWAFLSHFYRTGQKLDVLTLLKPGVGELLTPLPLPQFVPQRFTSRFSF